jgi:hypothetical protein
MTRTANPGARIISKNGWYSLANRVSLDCRFKCTMEAQSFGINQLLHEDRLGYIWCFSFVLVGSIRSFLHELNLAFSPVKVIGSVMPRNWIMEGQC